MKKKDVMTAAAAAKRVKEIRNLAGLTQLEFVELLQSQGFSVTQPAISKLERGAQSPTFDVLLALKEVLGVDVNYFFDVDAAPYKPKGSTVEPTEPDGNEDLLLLHKELDTLQRKVDLIYRRISQIQS